MWQVRVGRASEQRRQRAPHPRDVLQKLSAEPSGATSCHRLGTPGEGMRIGEAMRLDRGDIDWDEGLVIVRGSKSGRSRELVCHHSTLQALRSYDARREQLCPRPAAASFTARRLDARTKRPARRSALPHRPGPGPQPGRRRPARGQARYQRRQDLSGTACQDRYAPHPSSHMRHDPAPRRSRRRHHRAPSRSLQPAQRRELRPRRHHFEGTSPRPHHSARNTPRPLSAPRPADRLPRVTLTRLCRGLPAPPEPLHRKFRPARHNCGLGIIRDVRHVVFDRSAEPERAC